MFGFFRRKKVEPIRAVEPAAAAGAEARRARSNAALTERGVRVNIHLPVIEDEAEIDGHTAEEIFRRMRARLIYFMRGQYANAKAPLADFFRRMPDMGDPADLSPKERAAVDAEELTERQLVDSSWAVEGVYALAWSIGMVEGLPWPGSPCDVSALITMITKTPTHEGLAVRPAGVLLDEADLHYRLHWAMRQSMQIERIEPPRGVNPSVVLERRRALEWVIRRGEEWDEVDLST